MKSELSRSPERAPEAIPVEGVETGEPGPTPLELAPHCMSENESLRVLSLVRGGLVSQRDADNARPQPLDAAAEFERLGLQEDAPRALDEARGKPHSTPKEKH